MLRLKNHRRDVLIYAVRRSILSFAIATLVLLMAHVAFAQNINQKSEGDCSPNIVGGGNVTVVCPEGEAIRARIPGDAEIIAALDFINRGNMKLAAEFAEKALAI